MPPAEPMVMVYATCPDVGCAKEIAAALVDARLAACANILPAMTSIYRWEGQVTSDDEAVMILKTRQGLSEAVVAEVVARHPYEIPAVVVLAISDAHPAFLRWIEEETKVPASKQG